MGNLQLDKVVPFKTESCPVNLPDTFRHYFCLQEIILIQWHEPVTQALWRLRQEAYKL